MKFSNIILSWDFVIALIFSLATALFMPKDITLEFSKSFYDIGITVLSIVFSIFFTVLAIIMASSDNDFIAFLEEEGDFTALLNSFKITLIALFVSLIYSITLFMVVNYGIESPEKFHLKYNLIYFLIFEFLFTYSLIATGLSVKDTIVFSTYRAKYLKEKNKRNNN